MRQQSGLPPNASSNEIFDAMFERMPLADAIRWLRKGIGSCKRTVNNCLERLVALAPTHPELDAYLQVAPDLAAMLRQHDVGATTIDTVFLLITEIDHSTHGQRALQWREALANAGIMPPLVAALTSPCAYEFEVRRLGANALCWLLAPIDLAPDGLPTQQRKGIGKTYRALAREALEAGVLQALVHSIQVSGAPAKVGPATHKRESCAETFGLACVALERLLCGESSLKQQPAVLSELQTRLEELGALHAVVYGMAAHDGEEEHYAEAQAGAMSAIVALVCGNEPLQSKAVEAGVARLISTAKQRHELANASIQHALLLGSTRVPSLFGAVKEHERVHQAEAAWGALGGMLCADMDLQCAPPVAVEQMMKGMQLGERGGGALPEALCGMAMVGDVDALLAYISRGGDANAMHDDRGTLLHLACSKEARLMAPQAAHRRERFVEALLANGASVHSHHPQTGGTALHAASDSGALVSVRRLLEAGAPVGAADSRDYTSLMEASREGHEEVVQALIEADADLDAQQRTGMTALMAAVYGGSVSVVERLLSAGARTDVTDNDGVNAARMACSMGRLPMIRAIAGRRCAHCHAAQGTTKLLVCSRCSLAYYCSRDCQKAAWKGHKRECTPCTSAS